MDPPRASHNRKEKMKQWLSHNTTLNTEKRGWVGGSRAMVNGNKKTENPVKPCDLDPHCTLAPKLPDVCEKKNVFRLIRSSASGKKHLL